MTEAAKSHQGSLSDIGGIEIRVLDRRPVPEWVEGKGLS